MIWGIVACEKHVMRWSPYIFLKPRFRGLHASIPLSNPSLVFIHISLERKEREGKAWKEEEKKDEIMDLVFLPCCYVKLVLS